MKFHAPEPDPLTPGWVRGAVAHITKIKGDDEVAHSLEDDLHERVLRAIAESRIVDAQTCAAEALKTEDIDFSRWCA